MTSRRPASAALAVLGLVAALAPAPARADADLASDALLDSNLFLPHEANVPAAQRDQLLALTEQAAKLGVPIRIALVPAPLELGSVQSLWGKPQRYADFLGAELGGVFRGRVLVVMPQGLGVYHNGRSVDVDRSALHGIEVSRNTLGSAAIEGTLQLARVAGRRLGPAAARHSAKAGGGGSSAGLWVAIGIGAAALAILGLVTVRLRPSSRRGRTRGRP